MSDGLLAGARRRLPPPPVALRRGAALLCALATLALSALAGGAWPATAGDVALVIGNDAYREVSVLKKAVADARAVGDRLEEIGFSVIRAENLDRNAMSRALVDLDAAIAPGDRVLLFYAGHGFAIDGENYLLPVDVPAAGPGEAELVRDASFAVSRLVERIQGRGAETAILVLDACRNNPFEIPGKRSLSGSRGLVRVDPPSGVFVLFSAGSGQAALDRLSEDDPEQNSVFTRVLLDTLERPGLSLVRIAKETQIAVRGLAAGVGHEQTPAYYDQVIGDIVLVPGAAGDAGEENLALAAPAGEAGIDLVRLPRPPKDAATGADLSRVTLLYEAARAAEARGDALGARKAYLAIAEENLDVVDPYLRFAALLRVQEGRAGAREVFASLAGRLDAPAIAFVHALQFDGAMRGQRLDAFLARHPDYGPALYQAALELTADRLGSEPTLGDVSRQKALLTAFLAAEEAGTLARHFLDRGMLADWLDDAHARHEAATGQMARAGTPTASFMRHNSGWTMTVQIPEAATAIFWRMSPNAALEETGLLAAIDGRTGQPFPNPSIGLPPDQPAGPIEVAYRDASGRMVGPFAIGFQPESQLMQGQRQILEMLAPGWVETRDYDGRMLMYTTTLVSYNCAIREAFYGLDGAEPTTPIELPPCDETNPGAIPSDFSPYLELPREAREVAVRVTWFDGSPSKVVTVRVR